MLVVGRGEFGTVVEVFLVHLKNGCEVGRLLLISLQRTSLTCVKELFFSTHVPGEIWIVVDLVLLYSF